MRVDHRDRFEDAAPVGPLLFTYPANRDGIQEPLRRAEPVEQIVSAPVLLAFVGGNTTDGTPSRSRIASAASFLAQRGAGISHQCDIVPGLAAGAPAFDELEALIEPNQVDELRSGRL